MPKQYVQILHVLPKTTRPTKLENIRSLDFEVIEKLLPALLAQTYHSAVHQNLLDPPLSIVGLTQIEGLRAFEGLNDMPWYFHRDQGSQLL